MSKHIYFDNAATTAVSVEVLQEMMPCFTEVYGNSNSLHAVGRESAKLLDKSRDTIAKLINVKSNEIYFTGSGSEGNNWIIFGIANANKNRGNHIIVSKIEHHSILSACEKLEKNGFQVTYLDVNEDGLIDMAELMRTITPSTILVSVMAANNEVGTIQNLKAIAQTCHEKNVIFHTDAVQLFGHMQLDCEELGIDAMTMSAHKINGPVGVGAVYINNKVRFENLIYGGSQERGKRGGTVNVAGVVGFAKAAEIAYRDMLINNNKLKKLSNYFITQLLENIEDVQILGHPRQKLPNIVSVAFNYVEGESIMMLLDLKDICVSTGSACSSNSLTQSHVTRAMGIPAEIGQGVIRFSFSANNTFEEIDYCIEVLKESIKKLRDMSPIYYDNKKKKEKQDV